jgi:hypothetical protein
MVIAKPVLQELSTFLASADLCKEVSTKSNDATGGKGREVAI